MFTCCNIKYMVSKCSRQQMCWAQYEPMATFVTFTFTYWNLSADVNFPATSVHHQTAFWHQELGEFLFRWTLYVMGYPIRIARAWNTWRDRHPSAYQSGHMEPYRATIFIPANSGNNHLCNPETGADGPVSTAFQQYRVLDQCSFVQGLPLG